MIYVGIVMILHKVVHMSHLSLYQIIKNLCQWNVFVMNA